MKIKILKKIIAFALFVFFVSCEKDFEIIENNNSNITNNKPVLKLQKILNPLINNNNTLNKKLKQLSQNTKNARLVHNSELNFSIDTEITNYIEYGKYHSYTFPIFRTIDNGLVENLLLSLQNDGSYLALLISYNLTAEEKIKLRNNEIINNLESKTQYSLLNDQTFINNVLTRNADTDLCVDYEVITPRCTHGGMHSAEDIRNNVNGGAKCGSLQGNNAPVGEPYIVLTYKLCGDPNSGGPNYTGPDGHDVPGPIYDDYGNVTGYNNGNGSTGSNGVGNPNDTDNSDIINDQQTDSNDCLQIDANGNCVGNITVPIITENHIEAMFYSNLNDQQQQWWDETATENVKNDIIAYLNQNNNSRTEIQEANTFVEELIDDMLNFPLPEGEDNGDEFNYDDYSTIETIAQTLPGRNSFYSHFPKIGSNGMASSQVYQLIGGHPYQAHIAGNSNYQNACALRVSRALNYSGNPIPVFKNNNNEQKTEKGDDNLNYILDASSLLAYMKKKFPNSTPIHLVNKTPTEIKTTLNGKWGIYIMIPKNRAAFGASGHADFWSNTGCLSGCYFDKAKEVYFWELF